MGIIDTCMYSSILGRIFYAYECIVELTSQISLQYSATNQGIQSRTDCVHLFLLFIITKKKKYIPYRNVSGYEFFVINEITLSKCFQLTLPKCISVYPIRNLHTLLQSEIRYTLGWVNHDVRKGCDCSNKSLVNHT